MNSLVIYNIANIYSSLDLLFKPIINVKSELKLITTRNFSMALDPYNSNTTQSKRKTADHYDLNINPYTNFLFSADWKSSGSLLKQQKSRENRSCQASSYKKQILQWQEILNIIQGSNNQLSNPELCLLFTYFSYFRFDKLPASQKIAATAIQNPKFIEIFLKFSSLRNSQTLFNFNAGRTIRGPTYESDFFQELIPRFRIAWLSEPVLYIKDEQKLDQKFMQFLIKISKNKIFDFTINGKDIQQNILWFCSKSFHPLSSWLVNQFELAITRYYFKSKNTIRYLQDFKIFITKTTKTNIVNALQMTLEEFNQISQIQIKSIKQKIKLCQQKYINQRQEELLKCIEEQQNKPKKKGKKKQKKRVYMMKEESHSTAAETQNQAKSKQKKQLKIEINSEQQKYDLHEEHSTNEEKNISPLIESYQFEEIFQEHQILQKLQQIQQKQTQQNIEEELKLNQFIEIEQKDQSQYYQQLKEQSQKQSISQNGQIKNGKNRSKRRQQKKQKKQEQILKQTKKLLFGKIASKQLQTIVDQLNEQSNSLYDIKVIAFQRVRIFIQSLFPYVNLMLFGSNAIGLSLPTSDLDILLFNLPCTTKQQACMFMQEIIGKELSQMLWIISCKVYSSAKVPILKLQIDPSISFLQTRRKDSPFAVYDFSLIQKLNIENTKSQKIQMDISINIDTVSNIGYESTLLVKRWMQKLPQLQKILILFKYILSLHGLNKNFKGGIGSYCLFVMLAAYLQDNPDTQKLNFYQIFVGIITFYKKFDNLNYLIWLKQNHSQTPFMKLSQSKIQLDNQKSSLLRLVDPITQKIMSSSCNQFENIKSRCQWIMEEIGKTEELIQEELKENKFKIMKKQKISSIQACKVMQGKKCVDKLMNEIDLKFGNFVKESISFLQKIY